MKKIKLTGKNGANKEALISDLDDGNCESHVWWLHKYGYPTTRIDGQSVSMHQFLLGKRKGYVIDHIDQNRLNNQRDNLRFVTWQQNLLNSKPRNGRKYKGVYHEKHGKPKCWHVLIRHEGKLVSFGRYRTEKEAVEVYNCEVLKLRGNLATINSL